MYASMRRTVKKSRVACANCGARFVYLNNKMRYMKCPVCRKSFKFKEQGNGKNKRMAQVKLEIARCRNRLRGAIVRINRLRLWICERLFDGTEKAGSE